MHTSEHRHRALAGLQIQLHTMLRDPWAFRDVTTRMALMGIADTVAKVRAGDVPKERLTTEIDRLLSGEHGISTLAERQGLRALATCLDAV